MPSTPATRRPDTPLQLRRMRLRNRIIRSATFEGMADASGAPTRALGDLYRRLIEGGTGALITGFMYISSEGHAIQPGQCGLTCREHATAWRELLDGLRARFTGVGIIAQIAHAGRQTLGRITGAPVVGAGPRPCGFFREPVRELSTREVPERVEQFASAAELAKDAGFDAVQIHAAHGYLVHQFLSPWTNRRTDEWGTPMRFLLDIIVAVRRRCGEDFPIWVKLSHSEDRRLGITLEQTIATAAALDSASIDLIEISYGTMEWPMNIFRGDCPVRTVLRVSPLFSDMSRLRRTAWMLFRGIPHLMRLRPFRPMYNAAAAAAVQARVSAAVVPVGGIRGTTEVADCLGRLGLPAVALCRPLIRDPGFATHLLNDDTARSDCANCNLCAVYSDTARPLACHRRSMTGSAGVTTSGLSRSGKGSSGDGA